MKGATEAAPDAAYVRGDRLRTHILRPTWHSVLPEEIRWILALIAARNGARGAAPSCVPCWCKPGNVMGGARGRG